MTPPIPIARALELVLGAVRPLPPCASSPEGAHGLTLAADVHAACDAPRADNAAMDGYALRAVDTHGASAETPARLRLVGASLPGAPFLGSIGRGTAVRITTGARLPDEADAVIPQERVHPEESALIVSRPARAGDHIRRRGEELRAGDLLLCAGARIGPAAIGLLLSAAVREVSITPKPRVTLIVTGDELARPDEVTSHPERIVDTNGPMLRAACEALGLPALTLHHVPDDPAALAEAIVEASTRADLILSTGGASVGPLDIVAEAWRRAEVQTVFWKVAMKPGKPLRFGTTSRATPVFALPGNPLAALTTFERFVAPAIAALSGCSPAPLKVRLPLAQGTSARRFTQFTPGRLAQRGETTAFAPGAHIGSGMLRGRASSPLTAPITPGAAAGFTGHPIEAFASAGALRGVLLRPAHPMPPILSITGHSNSGKTRLVEQLVAALAARGARVGVVKRASHGPDFDRPGKDSARHAAAGAICNAVIGTEVAMIRHNHTAQDDPFPWIERFDRPLDAVVLEGYSQVPLPRIAIVVREAAPFALRQLDTDPSAPRWELARPPTSGLLDFPEALVEAILEAWLGHTPT